MCKVASFFGAAIYGASAHVSNLRKAWAWHEVAVAGSPIKCNGI
jgi:hypothetical protein